MPVEGDGSDLVGVFSRRLEDAFQSCSLDRYAQIAVFELPRALNRIETSNEELEVFVRRVRDCVTGLPEDERP